MAFFLIYFSFVLNVSRGKRVIELGSGYGLAGLVIAMVTEASEVVISDGNPLVVDCILLTSSNIRTCQINWSLHHIIEMETGHIYLIHHHGD